MYTHSHQNGIENSPSKQITPKCSTSLSDAKYDNVANVACEKLEKKYFSLVNPSLIKYFSLSPPTPTLSLSYPLLFIHLSSYLTMSFISNHQRWPSSPPPPLASILFNSFAALTIVHPPPKHSAFHIRATYSLCRSPFVEIIKFQSVCAIRLSHEK